MKKMLAALTILFLGIILITTCSENLTSSKPEGDPFWSFSIERKYEFYDLQTEYIPAGSRRLLTLTTDATLLSAEAAGYYGSMIHAEIVN